MAGGEKKWLSFSVSSMELMLRSSSSCSSGLLLPMPMPSSTMKVEPNFEATADDDDDSHHYYFFNNFYGLQDTTKVEQVSQESDMNMNMNGHDDYHSSFFTTLMEQEEEDHKGNPSSPKLEDFMGGDSVDSTLTHLYDQGQGASADHQQAHLVVSGFPALSTNSVGSVDVDSVASFGIGRTQQQVMCVGGESRNELVYAQCPSGGLSLGITTTASSVTHPQPQTTKSCSNQKSISLASSGQRSSIYRGVTRHRWTGRYEAHLWDNTCRREGQARKGRQVYLGGYDIEDKAARAYDLAALKYWGSAATTNLPVSNYTEEIEEMKHVTKQEFIASLRRKSSGFSRGASIYRGVTRHHQQGRWQARIGRVAGNKDLYLGTFATEEEAAEAYDIAAIKFRGIKAVTNFETRRYDVETIMKGPLPIGGKAKKLEVSLDSDQEQRLIHDLPADPTSNGSSIINFAGIQPVSSIPFDAATLPYNYHHNLFNHPLNSNHNPVTSGISGPAMMSLSTSMHFLQPPAEFYIWPHQSY